VQYFRKFHQSRSGFGPSCWPQRPASLGQRCCAVAVARKELARKRGAGGPTTHKMRPVKFVARVEFQYRPKLEV